MPTIYNIMGFSDAGKDTVTLELLKHVKARSIKWSRPMKNMLEQVYGLRAGILDDKDFRQQVISTHPDRITWAELMIRCYHYFPMIDPDMMTQAVRKQMAYVLGQGFDVLLTDTRNHTEALEIEDYSSAVNLVNIWVHRPGIKPKESDLAQEDIFNRLQPYAIVNHAIINDGSLEKLRVKVQEVIGYASR